MITFNSDRNRLMKSSQVKRFKAFLRNMYSQTKEDWPLIFDLFYNQSPAEGYNVLQNYRLTNKKKKELFLEFLYFSPQITCLVFGDQRMGKDATLTRIFQDLLEWCLEKGLYPPRFVTLGNVKAPPFVFQGKDTDKNAWANWNKYYRQPDEEIPPMDMYFSMKNIPVGQQGRPVYIYCSELEVQFPAREGASDENKLFSILEGTLAQNHQRLIGCVKLASRVDINVIRSCNVKIWKYTSPDKLNIEGVERANLLSPLGEFLRPRSRMDKSETLLSFDSHLFNVPYDLPDFWTQEYSEQFRNVPIEKIYDFVDVQIANESKPANILIMVCQKFRTQLSLLDITSRIPKKDSSK